MCFSWTGNVRMHQPNLERNNLSLCGEPIWWELIRIFQNSLCCFRQVANEWNELQTLRKTKISLQVILVIFLMKVVGTENLTTADPESRLWPEEGAYVAETSYVCRSSTLLLTKLSP